MKSENSFELQILLEITIHICAQSYTWKELTNYKKFERLFWLMWSQETRHFEPFVLDTVFSFQVNVCSYAGLSGWDTLLRIHAFLSVTAII